MAQYRTEQKKLLLAYLQSHGSEAYTVEELVCGMKELYGDLVPGISTVYRLMTRMVEEGSVKRFVKGHSRRFVYQIVSGTGCRSHFHMKCSDCGKLFHLNAELSEELSERIRNACRFSIDGEATVLFGRCAECQAKQSEKGLTP